MPAGSLVIVPAPVWTFVDKVALGAGYIGVGEGVGAVIFAVTLKFELTIKLHTLVPEHAPVQPENIKPGDTITFNDKGIPAGTCCVQSLTQVVPLLRITEPFPAIDILTAYRGKDGISTETLVEADKINEQVEFVV